MAKPNPRLIDALRTTAQNLREGAPYQWGHMGSCNCGHLAQVITAVPGETIHSGALRGHGDWSEQVIDYCPASGLPMDDIISAMLAAGLNRDDLIHLERLSDPLILKRLPADRRHELRRNRRDDVVSYLSCWADLLEAELLARLARDPEGTSRARTVTANAPAGVN